MNHHRTDRTISSIIGHLEALGNELPQARNALLDARNQIDGYPPGNDNPHVSSTAELTPTESAANQRQHIDRQLAGLNDELNAIALTVRNLRNDCQRYTANKPETPRCSATGRDGAIYWHDPTCHNVPSRGPLCDKHAKAEYRYRQAKGLPPRTDGIFTGDPAA